MSERFLPKRLPTFSELYLLYRIVPALALARWRVSFSKAKEYLPAGIDPAQFLPEFAMPESALLVGRLVERASSLLPWSCTCLVKALAAYRVLARLGIPSVIHLGVYRLEELENMGAHAWLTVGNKVLLGGPIGSQYQVISRVGEAV